MNNPKIMFVGDTHGNIAHWLRLFDIAREEQVDQIIQVGDFGFWEHEPGGKEYLDVIADEAPCPVVFIDGNHDNHPLLWKEYGDTKAVVRWRHFPPPTRGSLAWLTYAGRGLVSIEDDLIFQYMGGAFSIDFQWRQKANARGNECWWPEEEITDEQVERAINTASFYPHIDVLVAHDVPRGAPMRRLTNLKLSPTVENMAKPNRDQLAKLVSATMPRILIHGHYHTRLDYFMEYPDPLGNRRRLDCISLSCDPESKMHGGKMKDSYIILTTEELKTWRST